MKGLLLPTVMATSTLLAGCSGMPPTSVPLAEWQALDCDALSERDNELIDAIGQLETGGGWDMLIGEYEGQRKAIASVQRNKGC